MKKYLILLLVTFSISLFAQQQIEKPTNRTFWKISNDNSSVIHEGMTEPNQVTTTGLSIINQSNDATNVYPSLPTSGLLTEGEIYSYDNGMVIVVQTHNRTIYSPILTPALLTFYRSEVGDLQWITNEQVTVGDKRIYDSVNYTVKQSHLTLETNNPLLTISVLWDLTPTNNYEDAPQWVSGNWALYVMDFLVYDNGKIWKVIGISHTWIQPALEGNGAISWEFVADYTI